MYTFSAHIVICFEEFFFAFAIFLGDDYPRSRSVSAVELFTGRIFTVISIGVMTAGKVDPGNGFGQWCYHDQHSFSGGGEGVVDV